jgi:hypothetical protein
MSTLVMWAPSKTTDANGTRSVDVVGDARFRERLVPGWWVFAFALAFVGLIAVAYGAVLGAPLGLALFVVGGSTAVAVIVISSPVVRVDRDGIRVGAARLPRHCIGAVEVLDRSTLATMRAGDARSMSTAFTVLRPSRSRSAVRLIVADPEDPHPAWIVTSRDPAGLLSALQ